MRSEWTFSVRTMVGATVAATVVVALAGCGGDPGVPASGANEAPAGSSIAAPVAPRAPVDPRVLELAAGLALYEENCQICHGRTGLGDGGGGVGLAVKPANIREHFGDHSFDEMVARVVAGIPPAMPAAPISEDEVRLALSYIWSTIPDSAQARLRALQEQAAEEH